MNESSSEVCCAVAARCRPRARKLRQAPSRAPVGITRTNRRELHCQAVREQPSICAFMLILRLILISDDCIQANMRVITPGRIASVRHSIA